MVELSSTMLRRLATFKNYSDQDEGNCKQRTSFSTLARIGYEFNSKSGRIQCAVCHFVLEDLNGTLLVIIELHQKYNNKCEFSQSANAQNLKENFDLSFSLFTTNNTNEKVSHASSTVGTSLSNYNGATPILQKIITDIEERLKKNNSKENDYLDAGGCSKVKISTDLYGITRFEIQQQAKHPGLASKDERLRTFGGQNHKYSRSNYPDIIEQLVDAGLFYVGPADNVRCFFCDGGLKNFSPDDKPFVEHQKWFKECKFVKYLAEKQQRESVLQKDTVDHGQRATTSLLQITSELDFERPVRILEAREVKARLELPLILKLLEMGYQRDHVRQAIEGRFAVKGDDYQSLAELVEDMLIVQGPAIIPSFKRACTLEAVGIEKGANIPQPQKQMQITSTATASHMPIGDKVDGAGLAVLNSDASIPDLNPQDVIQLLKNLPIDDEELKNLWSGYQQLTAILTCQVCQEKNITTVFLPCGHYVCCDTCTPRLTHCCICRSLIRGTVKALTSLTKSNVGPEDSGQ